MTTKTLQAQPYTFFPDYQYPEIDDNIVNQMVQSPAAQFYQNFINFRVINHAAVDLFNKISKNYFIQEFNFITPSEENDQNLDWFKKYSITKTIASQQNPYELKKGRFLQLSDDQTPTKDLQTYLSTGPYWLRLAKKIWYYSGLNTFANIYIFVRINNKANKIIEELKAIQPKDLVEARHLYRRKCWTKNEVEYLKKSIVNESNTEGNLLFKKISTLFRQAILSIAAKFFNKIDLSDSFPLFLKIGEIQQADGRLQSIFGGWNGSFGLGIIEIKSQTNDSIEYMGTIHRNRIYMRACPTFNVTKEREMEFFKICLEIFNRDSSLKELCFETKHINPFNLPNRSYKSTIEKCSPPHETLFGNTQYEVQVVRKIQPYFIQLINGLKEIDFEIEMQPALIQLIDGEKEISLTVEQYISMPDLFGEGPVLP